MVSTVKARRRSERDNPQGMLGELSEEKETAYASLHAETTQQANGQERANVDYDRMHHVFFLVPHISRHGHCLCKARLREWRSTSFKGPERTQRFATHPSTRSVEHSRPPLRQAGGSEHHTNRAVALHIAALLAQVSSAEDVDARLVTAADSTDRLVALCDLCAALTRGKATSRATRPGKPSRIPTEQKCPQSNSSWLASNFSSDPFKQLARVNNQEYGKSSLRMQ